MKGMSSDEKAKATHPSDSKSSTSDMAGMSMKGGN
jgi:hypothetical protein